MDMKQLLLIASLVLLLGVGTAGAGFYDELGTPVCLNVPQMPEGKCIFMKGISDLPDPCLAKMEAAMRAEHPFLNRMYSKQGDHWVSAVEIISQETMDKQDESIRLWYEAKACWKGNQLSK